MRKKIMTVLVAALSLFCMSYLTGCGSSVKTSGDEATGSPVTTIPTVTPAASDSTTGWQVINNVAFTHKANIIEFYNEDFGISAGYSGEIHYSNDKGKSWPQAQNTSACQFGIEIVNENVAFTCGNAKNVVKTTDGGKTWNRIGDFGGTAPNQCTMLSFIDENTGFIASKNQLAYTNDSGTTWTELEPPTQILAIYLASSTKGYVIGMDRKLYITNDTGVTWEAKELAVDGFENCISNPLSCALSISEDGKGVLCYLAKGVLNCFKTDDISTAWTKDTELTIKDEVSSPIFLKLTRDNKYLTVQSVSGNAAAILSYVE